MLYAAWQYVLFCLERKKKKNLLLLFTRNERKQITTLYMRWNETHQPPYSTTRVSRWRTHWLHQSHSRWFPPPPRLGEVAAWRDECCRQRAASFPLLLQEALSAQEELHQWSKRLHLLPLNLRPHSVMWDCCTKCSGRTWENDCFPPSCHSPCWARVADAAGCGLELWTGTIFFITTGLPCPASSGPTPPVAMRPTDGLGATGG